jgi:hypothetical protein
MVVLGVLIVGLVKVLLVRVCVPVKVATVESIAMVPVVVIVPPDKPVPAVMDVTDPVVGVAHLIPLASVESAVSTCPFVPTERVDAVAAAVAVISAPLAVNCVGWIAVLK